MIRSVPAVVLVLVLGAAQGAMAQVPNGEALAPLLFAPAGAEVEIIPKPYLPEKHAAILKQVGAAQAYYGAIAISPDEGIMVEATFAAANYHTTDAASVAALAACDAKRKGKTPCAVVALIRPVGWKARPYQLSSGATAGFAEYMKITRDKAFAVSASTGGWGMGKGRDAAAKAVADCAAKPPKPTDCALLVQD